VPHPFRALCGKGGIRLILPHALRSTTQVSGHGFSRAVKDLKKISSLRRRPGVPKTRGFRVLGWRSARSCSQKARIWLSGTKRRVPIHSSSRASVHDTSVRARLQPCRKRLEKEPFLAPQARAQLPPESPHLAFWDEMQRSAR
jgi:hypothetical protein